jgi:hypothetical protein
MPRTRSSARGAAIHAKARRKPGNRRNDVKPDASAIWLAAKTDSARRRAVRLAERELKRSIATDR